MEEEGPGFKELVDQKQQGYREQVIEGINRMYLLVHMPSSRVKGDAREMEIYYNEQNLDGMPIEQVLGSIESEVVGIAERMKVVFERAKKDF